MVLEELDDDLDVCVVVLDGDDAHDVGGVLRIRVLAVLVGEDEDGVRLLNLENNRSLWSRCALLCTTGFVLAQMICGHRIDEGMFSHQKIGSSETT